MLLYDLTQDSERPVKVLDVCGVSTPVYNLTFNNRAPELFATTDQQSVKVRCTSFLPSLVQPSAEPRVGFFDCIADHAVMRGATNTAVTPDIMNAAPFQVLCHHHHHK